MSGSAAVRVPLRGAGLAPLATRDSSLDPLSLPWGRRETAARAAPVPLAGKCRESGSVKRLSRHILTARAAVPVFHVPLDRQAPGLREGQGVKVFKGTVQMIQ